MLFDFRCHVVTTVKSPCGQAPEIPVCPECGQPMQRIYGETQSYTMYTATDYFNRAYSGEEAVPGLSHVEARATLDSMKPRRYRATRGRYPQHRGDRRGTR